MGITSSHGRILLLSLLIDGALVLPALAQAPAPRATASWAGMDQRVFHAQVLLDRAGFSPGVIDGVAGSTFAGALKGFQSARGLKVTGKLDEASWQALTKDAAPATVSLTLAPSDVAGPFTPDLAKEPADQAKLQRLGYRDIAEELAERFHTEPATLAAINPPGTKLAAGSTIVFPNILPKSRAYDGKLRPDWKLTLAALNINAEQPKAERIVVDKSDRVLRVFGPGDQLIAQFPATMGSRHDPLPIGRWTIKGKAYLPPFHYNPDLFWDAGANDSKEKLPAGPNSPVGVVWIDLSKAHYGIHGTPEPEFIGRTESHGCIRLTNWDAARLAEMVSPGTPAIFQK